MNGKDKLLKNCYIIINYYIIIIKIIKNLKTKLDKIKNDGTIKQIRDAAIPFLTEKKIDNFILSNEEKNKGVLKVKSLPWLIILEPTNVCNLRCPLCPTGLELSKRKKGIANVEDVKKFLFSIKDHCIQIHLQNWGEPTLHKKLCEIISYCTGLGLYTYMSSNCKNTKKYLEN